LTIRPADQTETKRELIRSIMNMFDTLANKMKQEMRRHPLSTDLADGHIFVLAMLLRGTKKASDIAAELGITSGAVTGLTDKLAGMGLILRERSDEDRRVVLLSLTEEGRACINRLRQERIDRVSSLFGRLENEDLQKLLDVFEKLSASLDKPEDKK
jgi:DNA-binding MarR family transcriptional regulator